MLIRKRNKLSTTLGTIKESVKELNIKNNIVSFAEPDRCGGEGGGSEL